MVKQQVLEYVAQNMRRQAYGFLSLQMLLAGSVGLCLLLSSFNAAYSACLGGLVAVTANGYALFKLLAKAETGAKAMLQALYRAEVWKWLITIALFALLAKYTAISFLPLLLGYGAAQSAYWFALLLI